MADESQELKLAEFCAITNADSEQAQEYLALHEWNTEAAVTSFFADQEQGNEPPQAGASSSSAAAPAVPADYTGPRTLDGRPAPESASSSSAAAGKKPQKRTGLATLSQFGGGHSHGHDDDDDDDDEDYDDDETRGPRDLFAGGEKSGLAVQDPAQKKVNQKKLVNDILDKARKEAKERAGESSRDDAPPRPSHFSGTGQTLGGDGVESRVIPGARPPTHAAPTGPPERRTLHLWQDGFSIDDGPLYRFDDPANASALNFIRAGRAPLHLMNVRPDQEVNVELEEHRENWKQLPKIYKPFSGEGHRLGSPVPGDGSSTAAQASAPTAAAATSAAAASETPTPTIDDTQPTLMLRIQLPNGTRLPARFNTTHTLGDVYQFVTRAWSPLAERPWVLATTFPNKDHTERALVLSEIPEFKKGGTAVVKWL